MRRSLRDSAVVVAAALSSRGCTNRDVAVLGGYGGWNVPWSAWQVDGLL